MTLRARSRAAVSAAKSPAAPAPTTTRSLSGTAGTVPACRPGSVTTPASRTTSPAIRSGRRGSSRSRPRWQRHDWFGWERVEAPRATRDQLSRVHPLSHVDAIAALSARGGGAIDMDTSAVAGTLEAALRAAGGAVALVDALLVDGEPCGVSALRPPGHHAEAARAMGFCFFNNVAVAAEHARAAHGIERVLILDWDVHHGNGTNDIFHADPGVLFCSIHEWPLYPGTGAATDVGSGAGEGFTVNLPGAERVGRRRATRRWSSTSSRR